MPDDQAVEETTTPRDPRVEAAIDDLTTRFDIERSQVEVGEVREVTWPDGSIGCPQPGMLYTQALVDGYYIELHASGRTYSYHGREGEPPFLCEDSQGPPSSER